MLAMQAGNYYSIYVGEDGNARSAASCYTWQRFLLLDSQSTHVQATVSLDQQQLTMCL